jgi:hypothetical protein
MAILRHCGLRQATMDEVVVDRPLFVRNADWSFLGSFTAGGTAKKNGDVTLSHPLDQYGIRGDRGGRLKFCGT